MKIILDFLGHATGSTGQTYPCKLEEGMNQPQYLSIPEVNGEHTPATPNINPSGEGVTFTSDNASIAIDFAPSVTPIIEYVSIANQAITNVKRITATVIVSDNSGDITLSSPVDNTVVTGFPTSPLPANSTLFITFETSNKKPPYGVTISVIACFYLGPTSTSTYSTTKSKLINYFQNVFKHFFYNYKQLLALRHLHYVL